MSIKFPTKSTSSGKHLCSSILTPLIAILLLISCKEKLPECKYSSGLVSYLQNELHVESSLREETFYIVSLEGCAGCIYSSLAMLNSLEQIDDFTFVAIGVSADPDIAELVNGLQAKHRVLIDAEKKIFQYETGFGKPLLATVVDSRCVRSVSVSDNMIPSIPSILKKKNDAKL